MKRAFHPKPPPPTHPDKKIRTNTPVQVTANKTLHRQKVVPHEPLRPHKKPTDRGWSRPWKQRVELCEGSMNHISVHMLFKYSTLPVPSVTLSSKAYYNGSIKEILKWNARPRVGWRYILHMHMVLERCTSKSLQQKLNESHLLSLVKFTTDLIINFKM